MQLRDALSINLPEPTVPTGMEAHLAREAMKARNKRMLFGEKPKGVSAIRKLLLKAMLLLEGQPDTEEGEGEIVL